MDPNDSPLPSGNAMAALALMKLNRPEPARAALAAFAESLRRQGEGMSALAQAAVVWTRRFGPLAVSGQKAPTTELPKKEIVSMRAEWTTPTRLEVRLKIAEGFHLNAHDAGEGLIPTTLSVARPHVERVRSIEYPAGEERRLASGDRPLGVYEGEVTISVQFDAPVEPDDEPIKLLLHYQPCTTDACLEPTTARLSVP
jgi:DsbC/DsbD-like thiol-disulfide interchange protein